MERGDGVLVREFIAAKGRITKDSVAGRTGEPLRLRPWQSSLVDHVFARRQDGRRRHRVYLAGLPRKQGKTALAAAIALYGLTMEGQGQEVYSCAADKDQSRLVFGAAKLQDPAGLCLGDLPALDHALALCGVGEHALPPLLG
jgi:phage terminase large subunit-like protein